MKKIFLFAAMALMTSTMAQAKSVINNVTKIDQVDVDKVTVTITGRIADVWETVEGVWTLTYDQPEDIAGWSADLLETFTGKAVGISAEGENVKNEDFSAKFAFSTDGTLVGSDDGTVLYLKEGNKQEQIASLNADNGVLTLADNEAVKGLLAAGDVALPLTIKVLYNPNPNKKEVTNLKDADFNVVLKAAQIPESVKATVSKVGAAGFSSPYALDFTSLADQGVTAWIAIGYVDNNVQLSRANKVPANTGIYLKHEGAITVDVPTTTEKSYYVNMFKATSEAVTIPQSTTVGSETYNNYYFAQSISTGLPTFYPVEAAGKALAANKMYMTMPDWAQDGKVSSSTGEATAIIGSLGVASFSSDKDLDFTGVTGLTAWICTGFCDGNVLLSRVNKVAAGTGLYLKGAAGTYTIPVAAKAPYYVNAFVGGTGSETIQPSQEIDGVSYTVLNLAKSTKTGLPTFFPIDAAKSFANRMYLLLPSSVLESSARGIGLVFEGEEDFAITGISEIAQSVKAQNNDAIYNLNGQRVSTAKKGLYIVNGRKMLMK